MKKHSHRLDHIKQIHREGRLAEAKLGYLALLTDNPHDITVLHYLGVLHAEEGDYPAAQYYLEQALSIKVNDPVLSLHLANVLKAQGLFEEAEHVLKEIIRSNPRFAAAFNNLGTLYFSQEKWLEAVSAYQKAIQIQADYIDAYYNLGLALTKLHRIFDAMNAFQAIVDLAPLHPGARFHLGCFLLKQSQYKRALEHFSLIEKEYPQHGETQSNLALCYLKLGLLNEARSHYMHALEITPEDTQVLFNLGVLAMQTGRLQEAIAFYGKVLQVKPDYFEAHNNLGVVLLSLKRKEAALLHFKEALRLRPNYGVLQHTINVIERTGKITSSPPEYISTLFDSYADHYDAHLSQSLHYLVPKLFHAALMSVPEAKRTDLDILDLGCGTGLCGEIVKSLSRTLTGVDLSSNMLDEARKKNSYTELIHADALTFLADKQDKYDLVLAGDVLVYLGDLKNMFLLIKNALKPGGILLFNAEMTEGKDYELTGSARFRHSRQYLDKTLLNQSFSIRHYQAAVIRTQNQIPVWGHLYLVKKG